MFFVHDFRYKSIEEIQCKRGTIIIAREHHATAARLIVTMSQIVVLYYDSTVRQKAEYIDENDIVQQNYSLCLPKDISKEEIVSLMDTILPDSTDYYLYDACFCILAAMNVLADNPEEAGKMRESIVASQCDILHGIDDFFGLSLQDRGCAYDWEYNLDYNPMPRMASKTAEIRAAAEGTETQTKQPLPLPDTRQEVGERDQTGPRLTP